MQNRLRKKESPGQNPNHHCFHRSKFFAFVSLWDFFLLLMLFSPAGDLGGIDKDHWLMLCYPFSPIPTDAEFLECLSCP